MADNRNGQTAPATTRPAAWPFMAAPAHHDMQTTAHGVGVPARQEVEFKDGKRIWLARVMRDGVPDLFLRELGEPAAGIRIDLRRLIADVESELPVTSTRDVAGFVAFSLRLRFPTLQAFLDGAAGSVA